MSDVNREPNFQFIASRDGESIGSFNREHYPEFAVCGAMPEFIDGVTNIQIADRNTNQLFFDVPTGSVTRLSMPRLRPEFSGSPDSPFEKGIGLGLVACRILNAHVDLYTIEIPSIPEPSIILIPFTGIARPRRERA